MPIDDNDDITKLVHGGKKQPFRNEDEAGAIAADEVHSSDDFDELLTRFGRRPGVEPVDERELEAEHAEEDDQDLDLTPGALEKTNDPVRMYLREMGTVPLLTREGEVEIAKRIERGQIKVLKTLSRSPVVIKAIMADGESLRSGERGIKELVPVDVEEDEISEQVLEKRTREVLSQVDALATLFRRERALEEKLAQAKRGADQRKAQYQLSRAQVELSRLIRNVGFTVAAKKRFTDRLFRVLEQLRPLEAHAS
ncbi:MAG: sigma-70 factor domain-containing protein, partial [Terriglobales bacterium]